MVATCWGSAFSGFFLGQFVSLRPCLQATIDPGMLVAHLVLVKIQPRNPGQMLDTSWGFHAFVVMVLVQTTASFVPKALTTFDILRALFGCEDLTGHIQSKIEKITCLYGFSNEISVWALYFSQLHQVMHAMIMTVMGLEPAWKEMEASEPCDYVSLYRQQLLSCIFKEYDIIVDSPAGEPGSSFCGSADEEDWCGSLSFDASCWNTSRLWVPTYCLDEDEHRSLIDTGTEYKFGKDLLVLCMPFSPGRHVGWWRCVRHGRLLRGQTRGKAVQQFRDGTAKSEAKKHIFVWFSDSHSVSCLCRNLPEPCVEKRACGFTFSTSN